MTNTKNNIKKENITADKKAYLKDYYEKNKSKILETMVIPHYCHLCNCEVQASKWNRHCQGKKHKQYFTEKGELKPEDEFYKIRCSKMLKAYAEEFGQTAKMEEFLQFFKLHHPRTKPTKARLNGKKENL